jgi:hypothetical protein
MTAREYTLVEIVRDPRMLVCEASELRKDGHYYLYRYNRLEGHFYRATVPSGAAGIHFRVLKATDRIPLGGWQVIETSNLSRNHLRVVTQKESRSVHSGTNHQ